MFKNYICLIDYAFPHRLERGSTANYCHWHRMDAVVSVADLDSSDAAASSEPRRMFAGQHVMGGGSPVLIVDFTRTCFWLICRPRDYCGL